MMSAALALFAVVAFFMWAVLGHSTPAARRRTLDAQYGAGPQQAR
jgi:hypothetical protein